MTCIAWPGQSSKRDTLGTWVTITLPLWPGPSFALSPSLFHSLPVCQLAIPGQGSVSVDWAERAGSGLKQPGWSWAHRFFLISLGKKSEREREKEKEHIPASRAANPPPPPPPPHPHTHTHTHTTRFFCKGEPWMRLTKGFCKSPSWPPSMSTALGVKGRTNYIHSQQTPLLYNTSCPSLATAERTDRNRERERERERSWVFPLPLIPRDIPDLSTCFGWIKAISHLANGTEKKETGWESGGKNVGEGRLLLSAHLWPLTHRAEHLISLRGKEARRFQLSYIKMSVI